MTSSRHALWNYTAACPRAFRYAIAKPASPPRHERWAGPSAQPFTQSLLTKPGSPAEARGLLRRLAGVHGQRKGPGPSAQPFNPSRFIYPTHPPKPDAFSAFLRAFTPGSTAIVSSTALRNAALCGLPCQRITPSVETTTTCGIAEMLMAL